MNFKYFNELIYEIYFFFENIRGNEPYSSTLFFVAYLFFDLLASLLLLLNPTIFSTLGGWFLTLSIALVLAKFVIYKRVDSDDYIRWQEAGKLSKSKLIFIFVLSIVATAIFILVVNSKRELLVEIHR
ncbi:MAG: hypothetical protein R2824_22695 [Saprospiraceae bacterium]|nr:hypothetical protein [Lewinella sp.]